MERRVKWTTALGIGLLQMQPLPHVCSDHFNEKDFNVREVRGGSGEILFRRQLKVTAIPKLYESAVEERPSCSYSPEKPSTSEENAETASVISAIPGFKAFLVTVSQDFENPANKNNSSVIRDVNIRSPTSISSSTLTASERSFGSFQLEEARENVTVTANIALPRSSESTLAASEGMHGIRKWSSSTLTLTDDEEPSESAEQVVKLEQDMENYMKWKLMGGYKRMKKDVVPHKFDCQENIRASTQPTRAVERRKLDLLAASASTADIDSPEELIDVDECVTSFCEANEKLESVGIQAKLAKPNRPFRSRKKTMSPTYCCIPGCCRNQESDMGLSFFYFPVDPERCSRWAKNSGRQDLMEKEPVKLRGSYRVCGRHFEPDMFAGMSQNRLKKTAVPTLFLTGDDDTNKQTNEACVQTDYVQFKDYTPVLHKGKFIENLMHV